MGARILQEFYDHVKPSDTKALSHKEIRGLTSILLNLDDETREGCITREEIARWATGGTASNVGRDVIAALVDGKLIERVLYATKSGRMVDAYRGHPPRFRAAQWCDRPNTEGHHSPAACFPNPVKTRTTTVEPEAVEPVKAAPAFDPEDLDGIAAVQAIRSTWAATAIVEQWRRAEEAGSSRAIARRAMVILAEDPESDSPGRLMSWPRNPCGAPWFVQAEKEAAARRKADDRTAAAESAGLTCDYEEDPRVPGHCSECGLPKANARHRKTARTVVPFPSGRAKQPA